jgi:hypothetical protein
MEFHVANKTSITWVLFPIVGTLQPFLKCGQSQTNQTLSSLLNLLSNIAYFLPTMWPNRSIKSFHSFPLQKHISSQFT